MFTDLQRGSVAISQNKHVLYNLTPCVLEDGRNGDYAPTLTHTNQTGMTASQGHLQHVVTMLVGDWPVSLFGTTCRCWGIREDAHQCDAPLGRSSYPGAS